MVFIMNNSFTEVENPGEKVFNLPASAISSKLTAILCYLFPSVGSVRCNQFDFFLFKSLVESITIIGFISDITFRFLLYISGLDRILNQFYLMLVMWRFAGHFPVNQHECLFVRMLELLLKHLLHIAFFVFAHLFSICFDKIYPL